MLLILAIAAIGFAAYYFAEVATAPMRTRRNLVHRAANYGRIKSGAKELPKFLERVLMPQMTQTAKVMLKINPKASGDSVSKKLMAAGMRNTSANGFIAAQGLLTVGGAVFGLILGSTASPGKAPLFMLGLGTLGYLVPTYVLNGRVRSRSAAVAAELP